MDVQHAPLLPVCFLWLLSLFECLGVYPDAVHLPAAFQVLKLHDDSGYSSLDDELMQFAPLPRDHMPSERPSGAIDGRQQVKPVLKRPSASTSPLPDDGDERLGPAAATAGQPTSAAAASAAGGRHVSFHMPPPSPDPSLSFEDSSVVASDHSVSSADIEFWDADVVEAIAWQPPAFDASLLSRCVAWLPCSWNGIRCPSDRVYCTRRSTRLSCSLSPMSVRPGKNKQYTSPI